MADKEYIEREKVREDIIGPLLGYMSLTNKRRFSEKLKSIPAADVVSRKAYEQIVWERDTAIRQLAEIGKNFGSKMDDVRHVIHGRWEHIELFDGRVMGECSNCLEIRTIDNFCPNCGADMRGDETAISQRRKQGGRL